jgi:hypothetical protein
MAAMDLKSHHRLAVSVGGQAVELAGTAIGAVAIGEFMRPDRPTGVRHISLQTRPDDDSMAAARFEK